MTFLTTLIVASIIALVLSMIVIVAHSNEKFLLFKREALQARTKRMTTIRKTRALVKQENDIKKYAAIFGIDADADCDLEELLDLGKRVEASIGTSTVDKIARKVKEKVRQERLDYGIKCQASSNRSKVKHRIKQVLYFTILFSARLMVMVVGKMRGADRGDDGHTISHR